MLSIPNAPPNEYLGLSSATDGQRVFLGTGNQTAYLFDPFTAQQLAKVSLPSSTWYGSVALQGNTGVFGGQNTAKVFDFTNLAAITSQSLVPSGGVLSSFNASVDISGDSIIVGANYENALGGHSGAAYLFSRTTGLQFAKLTAGDGKTGDLFGTSVAIDGNLAVVGAPKTAHPDSAVYLFNVDPGFAGNRQLAEFNVDPSDPNLGEGFGYDVDLAGNKILGLENSGSAFLWPTSGQPTPLPYSSGDHFEPGNTTMAFNGQYAAIGDASAGIVNFYDADGHFIKSLAGPANAPIGFGASVAIGGDLLVVSAPGGDPKKSLVYVYRLSEAVVVTPEPGTASLAVAGLLMLGSMARGRRRSALCS
ncbi:hypothetical protein [Lacipirellula sp.]|uniref:FG-GAP repeat protein n=1 Tax=Lacipirellula sp. TaxID=2691419 RepID=UPI003D0F4738